MNDILTTIDDTLTYHSAALGEDLTVPVEREHDEPYWSFPIAANRTYELTWTLDFSRVVVASRGLLAPIIAMVKSFDEILPALRRAEAERRARLRRMRHLYRMRRR